MPGSRCEIACLSRIGPALIVAIGLCSCGVGDSIGAEDPSAQPASAVLLEKGSRQALAELRANGERKIIALVAAMPGEAAAVARRVKALGGEVHYRADDVAYLRVVVPIDRIDDFLRSGHIESVELVHKLPQMLAANPTALQPPVFEKASTHSRSADSQVAKAVSTRRPPKSGDAPLRNPYPVLRDLDAEAFRTKHPTFDGRGVTIAHVETVPDLLLPELQTAYTLQGQPVPKIADVFNVTDPRYRFGIPAWMLRFGYNTPDWVSMHTRIRTQAGRLGFHGQSFMAPRHGQFRIGYYLLPKWIVGLFIPSLPAERDHVFGVLWDKRTDEVWVDTNRDLSFADEKPLVDYSRRRDIGLFGVDDPDTAVRETVGFTVQVDRHNDSIAINRASGGHVTSVFAGPVVANRDPQGRIDGIAPGARMVVVSAIGGELEDPTNYAFIEGLIAAFRRDDVDLISAAYDGFTRTRTQPHGFALRQARHPVALVAQRLMERYPKLYFNSAGNGVALNEVFENALGPLAVSVSSYQSQDSYELHHGFVPEGNDHMHWGGRSHGPGGNGALKPDVLAPSGHLTISNGFLPGGSEDGWFEVPPGYDLGGGTSTAAPMAGGAAALVVSAAKQTGVRYDAERLKAALTGSARYIPSLQAHEQGNGLVQVEAAYELLKRLQDAPLVTIETRAPVRTQQSRMLHTPHEGVGLYEREGWSVGMKDTRTLILRRTSGPTEAMTFALSWQGNDDTFNAPASVTLPLNQAVEVPIEIAVTTAGVHSGILTLTHPEIPGSAHRILHTVIAPLKFTADNHHMVSTELSVPLTKDRAIFVDVPPDTARLNVAVSSDGRDPLGCSLVSPSHAQYLLSGFTGVPCVVETPESGVWEINTAFYPYSYKFDPDRPRPAKPTKVSVTASIATIEVAADVQRLDTRLNVGSAIDIPVKLRNRLAPVSAALAPSDLGSGSEAEREIAHGEQHFHEVNVPEGATSLFAKVTPTDRAADLDIYAVYAGDKNEGDPSTRAITVNTEEGVEIPTPRAGLWKIVVDAAFVPNGRTRYRYLDVYTHPKFGKLSSTDAPKTRATAAEWTTTARARVDGLPEAPRVLMAPLIIADSKSEHSRIGRAYVSQTTGD